MAQASRMDVVAIRRANLSRILQAEFDGNRSALARALDRQPNFVSEILSGARRSFGEKLARQIEARLGKEAGSLDLPPSPVVKPTRESQRWPFAFDIARFRALTAAQRKHVERTLLALIQGYEEGRPRPKRPQNGAGKRARLAVNG